MALIAQRPDCYLRAPRLVRSADGGAVLTAIAWEAGGERVATFAINALGDVVGEPVMGETRASIVAFDPTTGAPTDDAEVDHWATSNGWRVDITREAGVSRVRATLPNGATVTVFEAQAIAAAPAIAATHQGAWIAFHHNLREDNGAQDVAKWIALRFVDRDGVVHEPSASMRDRNRDCEGVEQSFEFPSLVVSARGAVSVFGRGSHNFWRQDLTDAGFGPRVALSDGEWGSRGRFVAATLIDNGSIVIARRERKGIEVSLLPAIEGRAPSLRPVTSSPHASRVEPARSTTSADPAAKHQRVTLFGDIQQHSAHSDGVGSADEAYLRARDVYRDDFVALTDHEAFLGKRTGPGEWAYLQAVADRYEAPGHFNTLIAYEWTGVRHPGPGHKCVYFPESGAPLVSRDEIGVGKEAVARIAQLGGFASPHHIGWTGADEGGHQPHGQPLWEICSVHGCYEHVDHPLGQRGDLRDQMIDEMLRRGHRFGFTASSDSHGLIWHHGESRKRDPYRTGLTAVHAESRTRRAIYDALVQRRCYATSGAKILLDVSVNGAPMGSEIVTDGPLTVHVEATGVEDIARIDLMSEHGPLRSFPIQKRSASIDTDLSAKVLYARVVQVDGEMAWSSPVFVDAR